MKPDHRRWRRRVAAGCVALVAAVLVPAARANATVAYGPYTASTAIDGRGSMNPNDRVRTNAYVAGQTLYLTCQDTGPSYGGSTIWDYTTDGYWEPDAYIHTGSTGFLAGVPRCLAIGIDGHANQGGLWGPYPAKFDIDGRGSMNVNDRVRTNAYLGNENVWLKCQDTGPAVSGSTIWDYTADGYWEPDAYLTTGTNGFVSGMPTCASLGITGGAPTNPNGGRQFLARVTLNGYTSKSLTASAVTDRYPEGAYITVMCQAYGAVNYGGSAIWDKTSDGLWVADYYVITGSSGIVMSRCDSDPAPGDGGGSGRYLVETTLNGYTAKSLTSSHVEDKYPGGSYVTIVCQAYGDWNYGGSAVWDKTSDGYWVADYYVKTGRTDIFLTRCDNDPMPVGGSGNPTVPATPSPGTIADGSIRDRIVSAALSQVGMHEWGDNCNPYTGSGGSGVGCGEPWCAMFASWTWRMGGLNINLWGANDFYWWGQQHGRLRAKTDIRPGDVVLFGSSPTNSHHIGVVVDVLPNGQISTIEGNWGDAVRLVGPYDPSSPSPTHENIYGVVAPITDDGYDNNWGNYDDPSDPRVCSQTESPDVPEFAVCLERWGATTVRAVAISRVQSTQAIGVSMALYFHGSARAFGCFTTVQLPGAFRTCSMVVDVGSTAPDMIHADAYFTSNSAVQPEQLAMMFYLTGNHAQEKGTYCGPASAQAALGVMGLAEPSQSEIASYTDTDRWGFTLPTDLPNGLNPYVPLGTRYVYDLMPNDGVPMLTAVNTIRTSLEQGHPALLLLKTDNLPSSWNLATGLIQRHYVLIYGYGGQPMDIAPSVPWDVENFLIWDPANDVSHTINLEQLYDYTYNAELIGTGSFVTIHA